MAAVDLRDGESPEHLITRFRQAVQRDGILREIKQRRHFIPKSERRRIARAKADTRSGLTADRAGVRALAPVRPVTRGSRQPAPAAPETGACPAPAPRRPRLPVARAFQPAWCGFRTPPRRLAVAQVIEFVSAPRYASIPSRRAALSYRIFGRTSSRKSAFSKSRSQRSGVIAG